MNLSMLYELQGLQKDMDTLMGKLKELNEAKDLGKLKEEYKRLKEEYLKGEEELKKNAYRQEVKNNEVKNLEYTKKASEEIKFSKQTDTVKKLETIEKHLEKLDEKKHSVENDIIELINEADNINNRLAEVQKKMMFIKKKYLSGKEAADKAAEELKSQKSNLSQEIADIKKEIDNDSFEVFSRLIKTYADPIALVEKRICCGCKMEVPAMDYEAVKSGSQELKCQNCGRLLYYRKPQHR